MEYSSLCLFLSLSQTVACWVGRVQNISHLVTIYEKQCGRRFLCSSNNSLSSFQTEGNKVIQKNCPMCFCDDDCEDNRNCCPNKFLSKSCVPTKLLVQKKTFIGENLYLMVSACPLTDPNFPGQGCHVSVNETNFLSQVPVYSPITNRTYVNIQCSKCHGEHDVIPWTYFISCPQKRIDLDVYSYSSHLWRGLNTYNCTLDYLPPFKSNPVRCDSGLLVDKCNITGEWEVHDEDISNACKNYKNQYGVFLNVFCFLCNAGRNKKKSSFMNDEEGHNQMYQAFNDSVKNFTLCDGKIYAYRDSIVEITEEYKESKNEYSAIVEIISWNIADEIREFLSKNDNKSNPIINNSVNLTALYEEYVRAGGYENWCHDDHQIHRIYPGFKARRNCLCDKNCFKFSSCCPDVAFYEHKACVPGFIEGIISMESKGSNFYLISKCPNEYTFSDVKSKCENHFNNDMFNIPVTDYKSNSSYKNIYCYLCHNQQELVNSNLTDVKAWNTTLVCPVIVYPMYVTSYAALLQSAILNNCSIQFTTIGLVDHCKPEAYETLNKCNATGLVKSVSENARTLCEGTGRLVMKKSRNYLYKNQICDLCNSEIFEDPLATCYTGNKLNFREFYTFRCQMIDLDIQAYPYKNSACRSCNEFVLFKNPDSCHFVTTYRDLFSFSELFTNEMKTFGKGCSEKEFRDVFKNTCRELMCPRGKVLTNNSCSYLVPYDRVLHYNVAFRVLISFHSKNNTLLSAIKNFKNVIQKEIYEGNVQIEEKYVYSNISCVSLVTKKENVSLFGGLVFIRIKITNMIFPIDRKSLELHLLNLTNITVHLDNVTFDFRESAEAWYLPLFVRQDMFAIDSCYMKEVLPTSDSEDNVVPFINDVNNLLLCVQIQLEGNEYVLLDEHSQIYVKAIKKAFKINEFVKSINGSVRLCLDSYTPVNEGPFEDSFVKTVLKYLTFICIILSMLFLLLTFVIFCLLQGLRTIPGKNIMCFSFSLFFAQLSLVVRSHISDDKICAWIGGFTHYFWISVFTCTNVCCFDMFRIFVRNPLLHGNITADRKLFVIYCSISFILPVVPVASNFIVALLDEGSTSFGYGGSKCFLVSHLTLVATFIIPIVLQIIFNIVMFSITFHFIKNSPKVQGSKDRNKLSIFLKLFLLTGVSWLFMILDGFFSVSPFTFLATIISGSLGVFIFISYVCRKNVFNLLRSKFVCQN